MHVAANTYHSTPRTVHDPPLAWHDEPSIGVIRPSMVALQVDPPESGLRHGRLVPDNRGWWGDVPSYLEAVTKLRAASNAPEFRKRGGELGCSLLIIRAVRRPP